VRAMTADGRPVAGVPVSADRGAFGGFGAKPLETDAEGRCAIEGVPLRRVDVEVLRRAHEPAPAWETAGWATPRQPLLVRSGGEEVVSVFPRGRTLSGRVEPSKENAQLWVFLEDDVVACCVVDHAGRFTAVVPAAIAGTFRLRATAPGHVAVADGIRAGADDVVLEFLPTGTWGEPVRGTRPAPPSAEPPRTAEPK
jgi:hypothetical protein